MANEKKFMLPFQEEEEKRKSKLIEPVQYTEIPYRDPLEVGNYDGVRKISNTIKELIEEQKKLSELSKKINLAGAKKEDLTLNDEKQKKLTANFKTLLQSEQGLADDIFNDQKIKDLLKEKKFEEAFSEADKYMTPFALARADKSNDKLLARDVYQRLLSKLMRNEEKIISPMTKDINKNREEIDRAMDKQDPGLLKAYTKLGNIIYHNPNSNSQKSLDNELEKNNMGGYWYGPGKDEYNNVFYGMTIPSKNIRNQDNYDTVFLHEKTHAVDDLANIIANMDKNDPRRKIWDEYVASQESQAEKERLNEILKIAESKKKKLIPSEGDITSDLTVGRSPSLQDYDWSKGQFKDKLTTPTDVYKETGSMHHYLGPEALEHIKQYIEEGVPGITENEPRFKKLSSLLKRS